MHSMNVHFLDGAEFVRLLIKRPEIMTDHLRPPCNYHVQGQYVYSVLHTVSVYFGDREMGSVQNPLEFRLTLNQWGANFRVEFGTHLPGPLIKILEGSPLLRRPPSRSLRGRSSDSLGFKKNFN